MPRIPTATLDRIKQEIPLADLAASSGLALTEEGGDLVVLCPFHIEETPSLKISREKNVFHCFGCGAKGSVIDWVMRREGLEFREAALSLARSFLPGLIPDDPAPFSLGEIDLLLGSPDAESLLRIAYFYHDELKSGADARGREYLEKRGLFDPELVDHFLIGFAGRTLGLKIRVTGKRTTARRRLLDLGLLRRKTGHEHLAGSVVAPIFDLEGGVRQMYGRKVTTGLRAGTALHLYLPSPLDFPYHLQAFAESEEVILCESIIDAWTFWSAGFRNVSSTFGASSIPPQLLPIMLGHGTRRVLIAFDRDEEGEKGAKALAAKLMAEGIECFRVHFPKGMDANSFALKMSPASQALDLVLRKAVSMGHPKNMARFGESVPENTSIEVAVGDGVVSPSGASHCSSFPAASSLSTEGELPIGRSDPAPSKRPAEPGEPGAPASHRQPLEKAAGKGGPGGVARVAEASGVHANPDSGPRGTRVSLVPGFEPLPFAPSVLPQKPKLDIPTEISGHEVIITLDDRRYRVRGLSKNLSYDVLKVNLLASKGDAFHVDKLDLYSARQRGAYLKQMKVELSMRESLAKADLGRVLLKLEELQDEQIQAALAPKEETPRMTPEERQAALAYLKRPDLLAAIEEDLGKVGIVGEDVNKLLVYLAGISRKLEKPLAVLVQSSSSAGKSTLIDSVLSLMPEEERIQYSAMTGQSLFYMGERSLKHKILAISEEEGAEKALYALKLLQSEGKLSIASTGKDPQSGRLVTEEYHVEGPAAIVTTTTAIDIDEEFQNRCIVLGVDEGKAQTEAIHRAQREAETLRGMVAAKEKAELRKLHQNLQRLIEPVLVVNPFAEHLSYPSHLTRTRRDHTKYLGLIRTIALLHQHQRPTKTCEVRGRQHGYIEVKLNDIEAANRLAHEVLGRRLEELPPQTVRLLGKIYEMAEGVCERLEMDLMDFRFSRRDVREYTGWGNTQLKMHLARLEDLEYLIVHQGTRGRMFLYELMWAGEGREGERFVMGLIPVDHLKLAYDKKKSGVNGQKSGQTFEKSPPSRPQVAPKSGGGRGELSTADSNGKVLKSQKPPKNAHLEHQLEGPESYSKLIVPEGTGEEVSHV